MEASQAIVLSGLAVGVIANLVIFIGIQVRLKEQREFTERNMAEQREALARYTAMHEESKRMRAEEKKDYEDNLARWEKAMDRYERHSV